MTVTNHPPRGGDVSDLTRYLRELAGDKDLVRSSSRGLTVPDDVALTYLSEVRALNADTRQAALPTALTRIAAKAEDRGGLSRPAADADSQPTTPQPARPRALTRRSVAAKPEEHTSDE